MVKGENKRRLRRSFEGFVTNTKMNKTITVESFRLSRHPKYGKFVKLRSRFKAHDEKGEAQVGDKVRIVETRPISKTKFFKLVKILERAQR